ncbi:hypothetical protein M9H77_27042 [Catharanthus roseus]|uniref:Uncharacterized protein n=1 Tax=Catharanthus roseus TaxID=4058 RepID=A0ACC0AC91_CATRO|nr:hypothetical protein M9H77_27042 [Catharanthus roseus]
MCYHGGPKEGQPKELDEDVEEDDSPPVVEIAEIDSGNEPTDGYGFESTVGENGESFKDKTMFLREAKISGKRGVKQLEHKREGRKAKPVVLGARLFCIDILLQQIQTKWQGEQGTSKEEPLFLHETEKTKNV